MGSQDSVVVDSESCDGENVDTEQGKREGKNTKQVIGIQDIYSMSTQT